MAAEMPLFVFIFDFLSIISHFHKQKFPILFYNIKKEKKYETG